MTANTSAQGANRLIAAAWQAYERGVRMVAPLMGFPGVELLSSNIKTAQQNFGEHYRVVKCLTERFHPDLVFPLMDLSVEANAMGRYTLFPKDDSATVPKDAFRIEELNRLREINISFDSRVNCYVETMKLMSIGLDKNVLKGAYVTGPYSLAALIMGADDAVMATMMRPDELAALCEFVTERIQEYVRLLVSAGAQVICVLEPTAVMLGPDQFETFSAQYVRHIVTSCRYSGISTLYHTCGDTGHVVDKMIASGVSGLSLDSPEAGVDLPAIARRMPDDVVIMGNICPSGAMLTGSPAQVAAEVEQLLEHMAPFPNFILSTGCDLPQETPEHNIAAFMETGRKYRIGAQVLVSNQGGPKAPHAFRPSTSCMS